MPDPALVIAVDGQTYTIRLGDLSALDAKDFRAAVGVSLAQVMTNGSTDLDVLAGLVWLARRRRERGLAYKTVAKVLTYDTPVDVGGSVDEEAEDPGEA
ncbi:MAG TPA: hypothetical protein VFJ85_02835 [Acidimicrobiales bacterium]|nr:hypothetical protein [Acidimicrobiales bacterium]